MIRRFKVWLAWRLLGSPGEIDREVEDAYAGIWPKHESTEKATKAALRESFVRMVARGAV